MASNEWCPPLKIDELYATTFGNLFTSINAPTAGVREEKNLPIGEAPFQLYSLDILATPNGFKVSIMLEELGIDYDAHVINIGNGAQFTSGFVDVNPNSKIPAAVDRDGPAGLPINLFESGSIVLYLAEKYNRFIPNDPMLKAEVMNWVFWQMGGQGPMFGNFGHFMVYAPADKIEARNYGVSRYGMEVQRLCDVLDKHLAGKTYMVGDEYTIADIMIFPWVNIIRKGFPYASGVTASDFLSVDRYLNLNAWADLIARREAVQRGLQVCDFKTQLGKPWLAEKK